MNNNGYIRKIDELGRVVIPKELRQKLKIHEGENLIINYTDKNINLSKYSYIENNTDFIKIIGDKVNLITNFNVIITDLEHIIYSNTVHENFEFPSHLRDYINKRESTTMQTLRLNAQEELSGYISIEPIISNSLCIGLVIMHSEQSNENLIKFAKLVANIISIHLDVA